MLPTDTPYLYFLQKDKTKLQTQITKIEIKASNTQQLKKASRVLPTPQQWPPLSISSLFFFFMFFLLSLVLTALPGRQWSSTSAIRTPTRAALSPDLGFQFFSPMADPSSGDPPAGCPTDVFSSTFSVSGPLLLETFLIKESLSMDYYVALDRAFIVFDEMGYEIWSLLWCCCNLWEFWGWYWCYQNLKICVGPAMFTTWQLSRVGIVCECS